MIETVKRIVREAGRICLERFDGLGSEQIRYKSDVDMVTAVDLEVQHYLERTLAESFPDIAFWGEEGAAASDGGLTVPEGPGGLFIVDPIDGTTSYVHGLMFYSVCVALRRGGVTRLGVVYAPALDLMYHAERGAGAFRNGRSIHVSGVDRLIDAVAGISIGCVRHRVKPDTIPLLDRIVYRLKDIRRFGSIALDLCFVADGRFDLFWSYDALPYDIAAGELIAREAGATVTDLDGGNDYERRHQIAATNGRLHEELIELARQSAQEKIR